MRPDQHHLEMYRSLATSAPLIAAHNCASHFSGELSCEWYHSTWPLLRLLDAVSTPYWHKDFYEFAMKEVCTQRGLSAPKVSVVGAADFAMAAVVQESIPQLDLNLSVIDQCETALLFNQTWAAESQIELDAKRASILNLADSDQLIDVAISDAFLTRFKSEDRVRVLEAVSRILTPGGAFITTVRDHSRPVVQQAGSERMLSPSGLTDSGRRALANAGIDADQIAGFELRVVAYCERMRSFPMNGIDDIASMCRSTDLKIRYAESCVTPGEFAPTTYIRLILERQ